MGEYYYLIASLPELNKDLKSTKSIDINAIKDLIERNLSVPDLKIFNALLFQNDNRNLLQIIFHKYYDINYSRFLFPSSIPVKTLQSFRRNHSFLPDYMIDFLQNESGGFGTTSPKAIELALRKYFLEYVQQLNSDFLLFYYEWQYRLQKIVSELNFRNYKYLEPHENHDLDSLGAIPTSINSIDKNRVVAEIAPLIEQNIYAEIEKKIDSYYWEFSENWTIPFSSEAVFAYTVKLLRASRWTNISSDPDDVERQFVSIIESLKSKHSISLSR